MLESQTGYLILDVLVEMEHYRITDSYKKSNQYYKDHYLCVWEVTEREIIGHRDCSDLVTNEQWSDEIILATFREHERTISRSLEEQTLGMLAAINGLSCTFLILGKLCTA